MRGKVTRQCPKTTTVLEEKGESKRCRTEVLVLTSLTPYRWAKPRAVVADHDFVAVEKEQSEQFNGLPLFTCNIAVTLSGVP